MLIYIGRRLLLMIPTLLVISFLVFAIIQAPPGDYLTNEINECLSRGEMGCSQRIAMLKEHVQPGQAIPASNMPCGSGGCCREIWATPSSISFPVADVVGDRLWLTIVVTFATILFTWAVAFPIGVYSAVYQYSVSDYVVTFIGILGLAVPSFLFALILLYFANVFFGLSIGGSDGPAIHRRALELGQADVDPGPSVDSHHHHRRVGHRRHDPAPAGQSAG